MPDTPDTRLIYITTDGPDEARAIGRALVEARLAACANVLGPMTSIYRWEGAVQEGEGGRVDREDHGGTGGCADREGPRIAQL